MGQPVGIHTIVSWNQRKQEWDLHPKLWETEAGRQRISTTLKVMSAVGAVSAGLMASGVIGSFSAVVVVATGIAAIVAYVAGRRFGTPRDDLWKDPEFLVKQGKAALQSFGTGQNCIEIFKRRNSDLITKRILKDDDIKALMLKKFNQRDKWTPGEFVQIYGIEGLKLLPKNVHNSLKENYFEALLNSGVTRSWGKWYDYLSRENNSTAKNIIEIVKFLGYDDKSLLAELCRRDMKKCENQKNNLQYTYPFIRERNTLAKMVEVDRKKSKELFASHIRSSNLTFDETRRDFSDELCEFYPNKGDIEALAADSLAMLDASNPQTYAAFKKRWGLEGLKKMSEQTLKEKVAPVAKAYFAAQKCQGLSSYSKKFGKEMAILGITAEEIAPDIIAAEIALLNDPSKNVTGNQFVQRNRFYKPEFTGKQPPCEFMSNEQIEAVLPKFIEEAVDLEEKFFKVSAGVNIASRELGLVDRDFVKLLVGRILIVKKDVTLDYLIEYGGLGEYSETLNVEIVTDENRESLKKAFYRMLPTQWALDKYAPYRKSFRVNNEELFPTFKEQFGSTEPRDFDITSVLTDWKKLAIVTDEQLLAVVKEAHLNNQNNDYSKLAHAAYNALDKKAQEQLGADVFK